MKTCIILVAVALASGQQFQQNNEFNTAVRLAVPGFFQRGGDSAQFQRTSSQSASANFLNQGANLQTRPFGGSRTSSQSESFRNRNQFQSSGSSFQQNQQSTQNSFDSSNRNQFRQSQQNAFPSNTFQQNADSRSQSTGFLSSSRPSNQNNFNQQRPGNQIQNTFSQQQNTRGRLTPINVQLTPSNRFQNSFQSSSNRQNEDNRFQQTNFNQQTVGSNIQSNINNRFSSGSQPQSNTLLRSSSGSSSSSFSDSTTGVFEPLNLPSGASLLLGSISTSFSCLDRPYGYYADEDNSCRVFHVCNPALFSDGEIQTYQYSFMCGEGTQFDQDEMTCKMEFEATPCQESRNFYFRNEQFGRQEDQSF